MNADVKNEVWHVVFIDFYAVLQVIGEKVCVWVIPLLSPRFRPIDCTYVLISRAEGDNLLMEEYER